ncbi:MAG: thioesterase family protein [Sorangiineae bacterium]|nr:thioesterase family protein [Polyangiaceae bacterium]MEB2322017.1 thioesterase family protein [Sorangiineae bacterium]
MYEFDEDTQVFELGEDRYRGEVTARWNVGPVPNGGYLLAIGLAAMGRSLAAPDPLTVTVHFLKPARIGEIIIDVERVKLGRTFSTVMAKMSQGGVETARLLSTWGDLAAATGPTRMDATPPELPRLDRPPPAQIEPPIELARRFEQRLAPETLGFLEGKTTERAELRGWSRFADGRPPDVRSLALFADAFPPPVLNWSMVGWVPTLELTVHFRARPRPGFLGCAFRTRFLIGGFLEEDGELWDESGALVAESRQLALLPR